MPGIWYSKSIQPLDHLCVVGEIVMHDYRWLQPNGIARMMKITYQSRFGQETEASHSLYRKDLI